VSTSPWQINVFGVRHLSPAGAWHLRNYLNALKPELVLIEGLSDASDLVSQITRKGTRPPIALLAYTDSLPVRTLIYPLAKYSPEFEAMRWAAEHRVEAQFIDLPSDIFLGLRDVEEELIEKERKKAREKKEAAAAEPEAKEPAAPNPDASTPERPLSIYEQVAQRAGEADYETYWERHFEHNTSTDAYRLATFELGQALRDLEEDAPRWRAENLVREAFMRRKIADAIAGGRDPKKIVAIVGAFHAPVLNGEHPAMSDAELASLRRQHLASLARCR